jgi:cell wall-associated NlpC family hydrolase
MNKALRAGVTGGVMGTIALATAASPASAAGKEKPAGQTERSIEATVATHDLASSTEQAADSLKTAAQRYEIQQAQQKAAAKAQAQAQAEKAKEKAEAAAKRKAEAARKKAAAAQASRSSVRTSLTTHLGGGNVSSLLSFLRGQVGKSYVSGATGPSAYDCSGLTQAAFKTVGINLPRTSQPQSSTGTSVSLDSLKPGDLLYWGSAGSAYHVGVYIGGGKFIGAQNPSSGVVERPLSYDQPTGAVRVL